MSKLSVSPPVFEGVSLNPKKAWLKPAVEIIGNDTINNGTNPNFAEGGTISYSQGGVVTRVVHFGVS